MKTHLSLNIPETPTSFLGQRTLCYGQEEYSRTEREAPCTPRLSEAPNFT